MPLAVHICTPWTVLPKALVDLDVTLNRFRSLSSNMTATTSDLLPVTGVSGGSAAERVCLTDHSPVASTMFDS